MRATVLLASAAFLLALAQPVAGQNSAPATAAPAALPATRTLYFDAQGKQIAAAEGADHREEMVYRDSVGGKVKIYYPSGKLRRIVSYAHFKYGIKFGPETSFYETGEIKTKCDYNPEGPVGYALHYYRNGQLRSRSPLGKDLPKGAKSETFGPDGQPQEFGKETEKMPALPGGGGSAAIVAAVQKATRYPVEALRSQISGRVLVSFTVDDCGFIRDVRIIKTPSPVFNQTVLAAVASLGRLTPGELGGEAVDVAFTVPLTFSIR